MLQFLRADTCTLGQPGAVSLPVLGCPSPSELALPFPAVSHSAPQRKESPSGCG